jgi:signal transduction histidine kinase
VFLQEALNDALELVAGELRVNGIVVDVSTVDNSVVVRADADGLRQVFVNLLMNAVHAISAKTNTLERSLPVSSASPPHHIRVSTAGSNRTHCEISVTDTGCGIPAGDLERIFVPFFTTKQPSQGTGLGLAIVQRSISTWGGQIDVKSREGIGTTFTLRLPLSQPS